MSSCWHTHYHIMPGLFIVIRQIVTNHQEGALRIHSKRHIGLCSQRYRSQASFQYQSASLRHTVGLSRLHDLRWRHWWARDFQYLLGSSWIGWGPEELEIRQYYTLSSSFRGGLIHETHQEQAMHPTNLVNIGPCRKFDMENARKVQQYHFWLWDFQWRSIANHQKLVSSIAWVDAYHMWIKTRTANLLSCLGSYSHWIQDVAYRCH